MQTVIDLDVPTLAFAAGLPGFPAARRFVLITPEGSEPDTGLYLLRSVDTAGLQFLVAAPPVFFPAYRPVIDDEDAERLGLRASDDALLLLIVTVGESPSSATANLFAPIVINRHTLDAAQVVLSDSDQPLRQPLFAAGVP